MTDKELLLAYQEAHKRFSDAVFTSVTVVLCIAAYPAGILIGWIFRFSDYRYGFLLGLVLSALSLLARLYFREMYTRWSEMNTWKMQIQFRSQSKTETRITEVPSY